jgi:hypothetical protein
MLNTESIVSLAEASDILPNKPSHTTLWRWCRKGLRGVKLEHRRCGRTIYTSIQALDRFTQALAVAYMNPPIRDASPPRTRPGTRPDKELAWLDRMLAKQGRKVA